MQRVRQPADPTFTIGSPTLHRADGSSHAERRCGCSCEKGPFLPWITPTQSVRPNPPPTHPPLTHPPLTRPLAGPPARPERNAGGVRAAANAAEAAARVVPPAPLTRPQPNSTTATTSSCPSRCVKVVPPSRQPRRRSCASRASATPCRCPPLHPRARHRRSPRPATMVGPVAPRSADAGRDREAVRAASPAMQQPTAPTRRPTRDHPVRPRAVGREGVAGVAPRVPNSTLQRSNSAGDVSATASRSGATSWRSRCGPG